MSTTKHLIFRMINSVEAIDKAISNVKITELSLINSIKRDVYICQSQIEKTINILHNYMMILQKHIKEVLAPIKQFDGRQMDKWATEVDQLIDKYERCLAEFRRNNKVSDEVYHTLSDRLTLLLIRNNDLKKSIDDKKDYIRKSYEKITQLSIDVDTTKEVTENELVEMRNDINKKMEYTINKLNNDINNFSELIDKVNEDLRKQARSDSNEARQFIRDNFLLTIQFDYLQSSIDNNRERIFEIINKLVKKGKAIKKYLDECYAINDTTKIYYQYKSLRDQLIRELRSCYSY